MTVRDANQRWQEAERLSAQGNHDQAAVQYRTLTSDPILAPFAHLRLSVYGHNAGDVREAARQSLLAFDTAHADPELLELLGKLLLRLGETRAAIAVAHALLNLDASAASLVEVGKLFSDHMLPEVALRLLRRALAKGLAPTPAMHYLIGLNLMYLGHLYEARAALESSLRGNPCMAAAHWALAKIGHAGSRGARIDRLRDALNASSSTDPALLWYSLFQELDKADEPVEAWMALEQAMRLRRAQVPYDEARQERLFTAATNALVQATRAGPSAPRDTGPQPIFVVGMPRSGTTIIEQSLCASLEVASAGELRDLALQMRWLAEMPGSWHVDGPLLEAVSRQPIETLGERYLGHTRWRAQGRSFYADKWPENYLAIGPILGSMPHARVICVRRGPMDACFSNLKEWFAASYFYSYDMGETARQYGRFDRLLAATHELDHARIASVEYEEFVRAPEETLEHIATRLTLPRREASSEPATGSITTASSIQVRAGVSRQYVGAWQRYREPLAPLQQALARLGYQTD